MFLDFGAIRIVHACWQKDNIKELKSALNEPKISKTILREIALNETPFAQCFWETCKGIDFQVPKNLLIFDDNGRPHRSFRMKWWDNPEGKTFKEISIESRFELPAYTIPPEIVKFRTPYPENDPIVFFGHYSLVEGYGILKNNVCCVDSGVSRNGKLLAYRWGGELKLNQLNFVMVEGVV